MKQLICCLSTWVLFSFIPSRQADATPIALDLLPSIATVNLGDTVDVDIMISGLGAGTAPSVGAFDLDVAYDPFLFAPPTVSFGGFLGALPAEAIALVTFPTSDIVDFAEVSLLLPAALDALQPASFSLATLSFSAVGTGTGLFRLVGEVRVDDAFGLKLISEPQSLGLIALGLIALFGTRRRCKALTTR